MVIIGIIAVFIVSAYFMIVGAGLFFGTLALSSCSKKFDLLITLSMSILGVYGIYYVIFEKLSIAIR